LLWPLLLQHTLLLLLPPVLQHCLQHQPCCQTAGAVDNCPAAAVLTKLLLLPLHTTNHHLQHSACCQPRADSCPGDADLTEVLLLLQTCQQHLASHQANAGVSATCPVSVVWHGLLLLPLLMSQ
jgi:hypothetical protein